MDVGCGGGILSESLARLGANVTGIDAAALSVEAAKRHAKLDPDLDIRYLQGAIETHAEQYDAVCALEVIEHVSNPLLFLESLSKNVKPNGLLFLSSINKTQKSHFLAITLAEYVLQWVEKGTHDWNKFISPDSLIKGLSNFTVINVNGIEFTPRFDWALSNDTDVNYIMVAKKNP